MGKITDVNQIKIHQNNIHYNGKKISKWWGKTLYYFDPKTKDLHYRNFTLPGIVLHAFGYKKKYNNHGLRDWINSKNVTVQPVKNDKTAIQGLKAFQDNKQQYKKLCANGLHDVDTTKDIINLIQAGLDINTVLEEGRTLLHEACVCGRFEVAKFLIEQGVLVNTMTPEGKLVAITPLQAAFQIQNEKLILLLIENHADVTTINLSGDSILHIAIDNIGKSPLRIEAEEPKPLEIISALLLKGADVNALDGHGQTPLYRACEKGDLEVVKLLIENGAVLDGGKYESPLEVTVYRGYTEIVSLLLEKGANPNMKDSLLGVAISMEHLYDKNWKQNKKMLQTLLEGGADVNKPTNMFLKYPLHSAIEHADLELVKLFIEFGADPSLKDHQENKTASELARSKNLDEIADFLEAL